MFCLPNNGILIFEEKPGNFEKEGGFTPVLGNDGKWNFALNRDFLGEGQRVVRWLFHQSSSFRMGTHQWF